MKRLAWWLIGIAAIVGICVGLHEITSYSARAQQSATITVGSMGSDYEVWQHIAKSQDAKKMGLTIKVKQITDGVQLNKATADGNVDVNAFQSWSYYQTYNQQNPKAKLAALGTTYLEPMGIYSKNIKALMKFPTVLRLQLLIIRPKLREACYCFKKRA